MLISEASKVVDLPTVLTVDEAAHLLRIGRTSAYRLAREYLAPDGARGIPVVRVGRQLLVPCRLRCSSARPDEPLVELVAT